MNIIGLYTPLVPSCKERVFIKKYIYKNTNKLKVVLLTSLIRMWFWWLHRVLKPHVEISIALRAIGGGDLKGACRQGIVISLCSGAGLGSEMLPWHLCVRWFSGLCTVTVPRWHSYSMATAPLLFRKAPMDRFCFIY